MLKLFAFITLCCINYYVLDAFSVWIINRPIKVKELPHFKIVTYATIFTLLLLSLVVMLIMTIRYCVLIIF